MSDDEYTCLFQPVAESIIKALAVSLDKPKILIRYASFLLIQGAANDVPATIVSP